MSLSKAQKWVAILVGGATLLSLGITGSISFFRTSLGVDAIKEILIKHTTQIETLIVKVTRLETLNEGKSLVFRAGNTNSNHSLTD